MTKRDPLDIEWWESPVTGRFDWDVLLFPIGAIIIAAVAALLSVLLY